MAPDPADRFSSADELADAVEAAANDRLDDVLVARGERIVQAHPWRDAGA
jgi:hypothetical protein